MNRIVFLTMFAGAVMLMGARGCEEVDIPGLDELDLSHGDPSHDGFGCDVMPEPDWHPGDDCPAPNDKWDDKWVDDDRCEGMCDDLKDEFFGPCGHHLGFGVAFGYCQPIVGCKGADAPLFHSQGACKKACVQSPSEEALCEKTGGMWDPNSCGHYQCGQFPMCDAIIPGCDCGPGRTFVEDKGCACDPNCSDGQHCDGNEDCHATKYCLFPAASPCGEAGLGTCVVRPELCPDVYDPVCGCDGMTYGNECDAGYTGVSVAYSGECGDMGN